DWPGNVRQMRSVIRRGALIAKDVITEEDLGITPIHLVARQIKARGASLRGASLGEIVQQAVLAVGKDVLTEMLRFTGCNKARAARLLKIDYKTIHTKVRKFGIKVKGGEDGEA
ncbi:MAG: hypothetical protein B7Z74_07015, partial [Deltaproteobacteria bacterium 21-66-5]